MTAAELDAGVRAAVRAFEEHVRAAAALFVSPVPGSSSGGSQAKRDGVGVAPRARRLRSRVAPAVRRNGAPLRVSTKEVNHGGVLGESPAPVECARTPVALDPRIDVVPMEEREPALSGQAGERPAAVSRGGGASMPTSIAETRRSSSPAGGGGDVRRLNLIAELAKKRRGRKPVVCGKCGGVGHNARTCAMRRATQAAGHEPGELDATLDIDHEPIPFAPAPRPDPEPAHDQELDFS